MKKLLFTLILSIVLAGSFAQKNLDIYLLIGQSNMAGRGAVEAQDTISNNLVLTLTKDLKWVPAKDPIHFDKPIAGVGPGRAFGIEMAKLKDDVVIGLIPCAVGGSPIDVWKPGAFYEAAEVYPWDDMEKRLKYALQFGKLKGVLWQQGEADTALELAHAYGQKLTDLIERIRLLAGNPKLPFVAGEMVNSFQAYNGKEHKGTVVYPKMVTYAIKLVAEKDPNVEMVKSNGLKDRGDELHFNSESARKLGVRYAKAMMKLEK